VLYSAFSHASAGGHCGQLIFN